MKVQNARRKQATEIGYTPIKANNQEISSFLQECFNRADIGLTELSSSRKNHAKVCFGGALGSSPYLPLSRGGTSTGGRSYPPPGVLLFFAIVQAPFKQMPLQQSWPTVQTTPTCRQPTLKRETAFCERKKEERRRTGMAIGRARMKLEWSSEANQPPVSSLALADRPTTRHSWRM